MSMRSWIGSLFTRSSHVDDLPDDPDDVDFQLERAKQELGAAFHGQIPVIEDYINDKDPDRFLAAYRKMIHDPAVKAGLLSLIFEVASLNLRVQPNDPEDEKDKEVASFIQHALESVAGGVPRGLIVKMLYPALIYQYSISEIVYRTELRGKWRGMWILKALKSKDVSDQSWGFLLDAFRNIKAFIHTQPDVGTLDKQNPRYSHPDKFVHYTFMPMFENPRGLSHLRAAYRAWYVKQAVSRAWAFHAQAQGILPIAKYKDKTHKLELEKQLAGISARKWLAVPESVQMEIIKLSDSSTDQGFKDVIERLDKQIFLSLQFAFLQALEGDKTGARNMGEVHKSTSKLLPWYMSEDVAEAISGQIVETLVRFNFGEEVQPPRISLEAPVEEDMLVKAQTLQQLVASGLQVSAQQVSETFGWKMPEGDKDRLTPPAPAAAPSPFDFAREEDDEITRASRSASLAAANGESWRDEFASYYSRARKGRS